MALRLPSTSALRGLEAAARLRSFTAAGEELNLTQGAISRQIRELEQLLGVELFHRSTRQIELTAAGEDYVAAIRPLLHKLAAAGEEVRNRRQSRTLTISVLPTFASMWLMPRLNSFSQSNPDFDLRIVSSIEPAQNLEKEGAIAVRVGTLPGQHHSGPRISLQMVTHWEGIDAEPLFPDTLVPICSRSLIDGPIPSTAAEIAEYPLIHVSTRIEAWGDWLSAQGVHLRGEATSGPVFGHFFMALEAARRGLGIALLPKILLQELSRDGDLLILPSEQIPSAGSYYLLTHEINRGDVAIDCFRDWIHLEANFNAATPQAALR